MKLALVALVLVGALACELVAARSHSNLLAWRQFKQQHGKTYATQEEDNRRFFIFMATKGVVDRHNADASASYTMGLNHMADWTPEEKACLNGIRLPDGPRDFISHEELAAIIGQDAPVPEEVDWRKVKGRVTGIKDQGSCGSCWAFSTTGLLEGQELPQNMSTLVSLSEQFILDCSLGGFGCFGGWMANALDSLANNVGGVESESDYPYTGNFQKCASDEGEFLPLKVKGHKFLPQGDEKTLKQVVANYGPVAVAFDSTMDNFHHYKGGIYDDHQCSIKEPTHGALLIGYGKDPKQGDYWIVKNSWGTGWGEEGYVRMKAGENICGIANYPTLATF